jgi:hypothetical protein
MTERYRLPGAAVLRAVSGIIVEVLFFWQLVRLLFSSLLFLSVETRHGLDLCADPGLFWCAEVISLVDEEVIERCPTRKHRGSKAV